MYNAWREENDSWTTILITVTARVVVPVLDTTFTWVALAFFFLLDGLRGEKSM